MTREILHVGLGSTACHVSAHYLNLQGLSVTSSSSSSPPWADGGGTEEQESTRQQQGRFSCCDPSISYTTFHRVLVPRALLIDDAESGCRISSSDPHNHHHYPATTTTTTTTHPLVDNDTMEFYRRPLSLQESQTVQDSSKVWSGAIERLERRDNRDKNNHPRSPEGSSSGNSLLLANVRETAAQIAFGSYSRYRVPDKNPFLDNHEGYSISSNQRAVDWDDLPEQEEEEEDTDELSRREQDDDESQWKQHVYPQLQQRLESSWDKLLAPVVQAVVENNDDDDRVRGSEQALETVYTKDDERLLSSWQDFLMPPYHPMSILNIPLSKYQSSDSHLAGDWDHYYPVASQAAMDSSSSILGGWTQDIFLDRIRHMLEDCDCCQGFTIASSGHGAYAGLAAQLLQYLRDDCPSARRWVWSLDESPLLCMPPKIAAGTNDTTTTSAVDPSWRRQHVERTRTGMEVGLMWHDYIDSAHAVLDLQLPIPPSSGGEAQRRNELFHASAILAAALETSTLPYRLSSGNTEASIGLKSYNYGDYTGGSSLGSVARMTLPDFLSHLQPTPGLAVLELDALSPYTTFPDDEDAPWSRIIQGTSLERDQRIKFQPKETGTRRPRDVLPGLWMMGTSHGGILSPLSPNRSSDRSTQTHFALATAFRGEYLRSTTVQKTSTPTFETYVDCFLEGMGIRYRPEQSFATHLHQSLSDLTRSGYGAGSYWKHVWCPTTTAATTTSMSRTTWKRPVLSVLGNTTRFYPQVSQMGIAVKQVLSRQSRGFFQRDVANEILPEEDNCHEVLSTLYNLRDRYQPPHRSNEGDDDANSALFMD